MELLGLYNNQTYVLERLRSIMNLEDGRRQEVQTRPKQRRTRLSNERQGELLAAYQAGESVYELGARFGIARQTVSSVLERCGIPRRYRLLTVEDLEILKELYRAGDSLTAIGDRFRVSPSTVRKALLGSGTRTRPIGTNQWR